MNNEPQTNPAEYARTVVEAMMKNLPVPDPPDEDFYRQLAACFVSIKMDGQLRGCIGTLAPVEPNLGHELIRNARSAAFGDPRFPATRLDELPSLIFSVDVLSPSEAVTHSSELDCETYGVIVSCDYRRGVLLPDLEGVVTVEEQLSIACQKAGIASHEQFQVERFTVDRYRETA
jgi:AmmeMemoRadiSam system protein A